MKDHHLQLNLAKTELLVFPAKTEHLPPYQCSGGFTLPVTNQHCPELRRNNRQWPHLHRTYCYSHQILQIHTIQHQEDQTLSLPVLSPTSRSDHGLVKTRLLQLRTTDWPPSMYHQTSPDDTERSSPPHLLTTKEGTFNTSPGLTALAPHRSQD